MNGYREASESMCETERQRERERERGEEGEAEIERKMLSGQSGTVQGTSRTNCSNGVQI